uniref:Uncharacterized protein n=1 Tax=Clastoptera arizonana TaxID=38151 RepID=A0A1B6CU27_9HEMI
MMYKCVIILFVNLLFNFCEVYMQQVFKKPDDVTYIVDMKFQSDYEYPTSFQSNTPVFPNKQRIIDLFLESKTYVKKTTDKILSDYNECYTNEDVPIDTKFYKPFIVIHGNHHKKTAKIVQYMAMDMGVNIKFNPPKCMDHLTYRFKDTRIANHAYYALALYVVAFQTRQTLAYNISVVTQGYWTDQAIRAAYNLIRSSKMCPDFDSIVFKIPDDLMKPDIVLYLDFFPPLNSTIKLSMNTDDEFTTTFFYKRLQERTPFPINVITIPYNMDVRDVMDKMMDELYAHFGSRLETEKKLYDKNSLADHIKVKMPRFRRPFNDQDAGSRSSSRGDRGPFRPRMRSPRYRPRGRPSSVF